jgi:hypothetical protein
VSTLVVASVGPGRDGPHDPLLAELLRRRAEEGPVRVLSVDPTAVADGSLGRGAGAFVRLAVRVRRVDHVLVRLEQGFPVPPSCGRLSRALRLVALAGALWASRDATLWLASLDDLPGGPGGRAAGLVWREAGEVVAGDEAVRAALAAVGVPPDRVRLAARPEQPGVALARYGELGEVGREEVVALVRRRAARERAAARAMPPLPPAPAGGGVGGGVAGWHVPEHPRAVRRDRVPVARPLRAVPLRRRAGARLRTALSRRRLLGGALHRLARTRLARRARSRLS